MNLAFDIRKLSLKPRGKNLRITYLLRCLGHQLAPRWWLSRRSKDLLNSLEGRSDKEYIWQRVNYYCQLRDTVELEGQYTLGTMPKNKSNYFRDFFEYARFFEPTLKVDVIFKDNRNIPPTPSIMKSRSTVVANENGVLCNLDKVRHFTFLNDKLSFESKKDKAIFRGAVYQQCRIDFMEKYFGSEWVDCGDTGNSPRKPEWRKSSITLYDHLKYKFILAIEGWDVASNLKWIMSSNSIAVMPKPTVETWFMEGTLISNCHYIEIKPDYSDLPERLQYYIDHPEEAKKIIQNAHEYVKQFQDKDREDLIHLLVLKKYFSLTNPGQKLMK